MTTSPFLQVLGFLGIDPYDPADAEDLDALVSPDRPSPRPAAGSALPASGGPLDPAGAPDDPRRVTTARAIADLLGVDVGDVCVVIENMVDLPDDEVPQEYVGEVHSILDQHGVRTTPAEWYPGLREEWIADGMPTGSAYHRWFHTTKDFDGHHYPDPLGG